MDFTVQLNDAGLTLKNTGSAATVPLGGSNSIELPDGAVIQPPAGHYWHIDMNRSSGVSLQGTHGPVDMGKNSSAFFYIDSL